jgi:hypothetical protein
MLLATYFNIRIFVNALTHKRILKLFNITANCIVIMKSKFYVSVELGLSYSDKNTASGFMKKGVLRMFETKRKRSNRKVGKISY